MALVDEVQSRYAAARIKQLTNPGVPGGTSAVDTARLALAATDVEAEFAIYCGVAYDGSVATHVTVAVEGVIAKLKTRLETPSTKEWDEWVDRAKALSLVTGRNKITPTTKSTIKLTTRPTQETPDTDRSRFTDIVPNPPN